MSVILVVDNADVGFLYALTIRLKSFEIWLIPADSVEKAHLLRKHIGRLDLLIINCNVPGVCPFAVVMARHLPGLKILGSPPRAIIAAPAGDFVLRCCGTAGPDRKTTFSSGWEQYRRWFNDWIYQPPAWTIYWQGFFADVPAPNRLRADQ
jgi:hypothetical protein